MAINLKNFDYKQFLLERGEQVGVGAAIAITALMVVFGFFLPAFSTKSASANAKDLDGQSQSKKQQLNSAAPSDQERAQLKSWDPRLRTDRPLAAADPDAFRVVSNWFAPSALDDTKRRAPLVKVPREFRSTVELAQIEAYLLKIRDGNPETIMVLEGTAPAAGNRPGGSGAHPGQFYSGSMGGGPHGAGPHGGSGSGMGPPPGLGGGQGGGDITGSGGRPGSSGAYGMMQQGGGMMPQGIDPTDTKARIKPVKIDELDGYLEKFAKDNARLAEDVLPLRMVVITGSFPYKEQLEEFKHALRAPSIEALFGNDKQNVPEFLPFYVERRELKSDGTFTAWQKLDLPRSMRTVALMTGQRYEKEDPALEAVSFPGLVMHRPIQFKENQTDRIDLQLKLLKETRDEIKDAQTSKVIKPRNPFQKPNEIDPFNPSGLDDTNTMSGPGMVGSGMPGAGGGPKPGGPKPGGLGSDGPSSPPPGSAGSAAGGSLIPKYCLVRLIDVTVEPGKTYSYRMQIRMTNPNKERKDVAWASLAKEDEVRSEWIEIKDDSKAKDQDRIYVQPEAFAYVVDQGLVSSKDYNGNRTPPKPDQVVMQVHRWLDYVFPDYPEKASGFPVGEWSIGERMLVNRGEFISRPELVEVPRRLVMEERFGMAVHKKNKKIPVIFGLNSGYGDLLLVDFQGGKMTHTRPALTDDSKPQTVDDRAPIEALFMAPNGRLLVRDSATDSADEERTARYEAWKTRLKDVKEQKPGAPKPGTGGPNIGNPFGGGGGSTNNN